MKKILFLLILIGGYFTTSCDKVKNPYPPTLEIDTTLYPGIWSDYETNHWPDFSALPNEDPLPNAIIEDFTGHSCAYCPAAGDVAHNLHLANPDRVFIASIHASANGNLPFQTVNNQYTIQFYNEPGIAIGSYFGTTLQGTGFTGNPGGMINRQSVSGEYFPGTFLWQSFVNTVLNSTLKVAIKAKVNYYEAPKHGFYLHTEIEKLDASLTNELGLVTYIMQDSIVGPQLIEAVYTPDYIHRDIMRGTIDGQIWGKALTENIKVDGKYYVNYSYILPDELAPTGVSTTHNPNNMHLLIYVYDKTTYEIYQVIKKKIIP
jgi:hypothetical protein